METWRSDRWVEHDVWVGKSPHNGYYVNVSYVFLVKSRCFVCVIFPKSYLLRGCRFGVDPWFDDIHPPVLIAFSSGFSGILDVIGQFFLFSYVVDLSLSFYCSRLFLHSIDSFASLPLFSILHFRYYMGALVLLNRGFCVFFTSRLQSSGVIYFY